MILIILNIHAYIYVKLFYNTTCHSFRQHDFDNNTKLDGLEIYKALTDIIPYNSEELEKIRDPSERRTRQEKYYSGLQIHVLQ